MSDFRSYDVSRAGGVTTVQARNKVLRNTYLLLALSMIPTVLGAWIGVAAGLTTLMAANVNNATVIKPRPTGISRPAI